MRHGHPLATLLEGLQVLKVFVLVTLWFTLYISSVITEVEHVYSVQFFKLTLEVSVVPAVFCIERRTWLCNFLVFF